MANAELKRLTLVGFKSYRERATLTMAPLTVLLGRNNSGKSSLIQALLLLKQTLAYPRKAVPLYLEGEVDALNLQELTWGSTQAGSRDLKIGLTWESTVDVEVVLEAEKRPDLTNLAKLSGIEWMIDPPRKVRLETTLSLGFGPDENGHSLSALRLSSKRINPIRINPSAQLEKGRLSWIQPKSPQDRRWNDQLAVELDHFIPLVSIDKRKIGPRDRRRSYFNGFKILYEQPLEDLRRILSRLSYLGSTRTAPPSVYRPTAVPPEEVGVNGIYAAQLIHSRQKDVVHYAPPLAFEKGGAPQMPETILARPVAEAFNHVLQDLGVDVHLEIQDIENIGFRLFFGGFPLQHVGYGLGHLLPAVVLGLTADPLRYREPLEDLPLADYLGRCPTPVLAALEEPESHLHPKVQTRLAHWFVALAMSGRRLLVETHSDHLVRRLRGLIARAPRDSEVERWLAENVVIAEVEQDDAGASTLTCSRLTETGGIVEKWPADFMDEAAEEEDSIYYARLDKTQDGEEYAAETEFVHDAAHEA